MKTDDIEILTDLHVGTYFKDNRNFQIIFLKSYNTTFELLFLFLYQNINEIKLFVSYMMLYLCLILVRKCYPKYLM